MHYVRYINPFLCLFTKQKDWPYQVCPVFLPRYFHMVGVRGLEPPASWSRTKRSTKLSHTPFFHALELYHICGGLSIFFLQLLSFFCFPDCGDERCRFASRRRGRVRASCIGKCQMLFVFPIGRQARSLFHATVRLKILHRFANISFSK